MWCNHAESILRRCERGENEDDKLPDAAVEADELLLKYFFSGRATFDTVDAHLYTGYANDFSRVSGRSTGNGFLTTIHNVAMWAPPHASVPWQCHAATWHGKQI